MAESKPTQATFTWRGVEFHVLGTLEVERTAIVYHINMTSPNPVLQAFITCNMRHKINDAAHAQREAWDCLMWDLVSASPNQSLIRHLEPELIPLNDEVSLRTLIFHAPPGEPSRLFYISTGEERGIYILAMDDDVLCPDKELIRQLLEKYARRTLYEPLNKNQKSPTKQDLDEECTLQRLLPIVFTSADDLDGDQPLFLSTVLAAIHYIIVQIDAWRGINQFYKCRNELRLRKVSPSVDGNRIMIKEEGDVLYIILPLDCTKQRFCDVLLAALHGYAAYIFTKMLTDVIVPGGVLPDIPALQQQALNEPRSMSLLSLYRVQVDGRPIPGGQRVRLATTQQQQDWWTALTIDVYNNFYAGTNDLLTIAYKPGVVRRIPLYCYVDSQHDLPEIEALESSPYRKALASTVEKMEMLRLQLQSVNSDLIEKWARESREIIQEYPNNYLGIFDKDSRFSENLTLQCPVSAPTPIHTLSSLQQQQQLPQKRVRIQDNQLQYDEDLPADIGYKQIRRESALFSLYSNEEHELDVESLQRAADFLEEYGFVILTDDYFEDQALDMVSSSLTHDISKLYVGSAEGSFPISRGLCQLDIEPLVYNTQVWTEIRGNEMLFESFRGVVEHTSEGEHWKEEEVRLQILPPSTTYKKSGSTRKFRIHWRLQPNPTAPYMGMVTIDDMSDASLGGLVLAPGFHKQADIVYNRIRADELARMYYYNKEHLHTFPFSNDGKGLPPTIKEVVDELLPQLAFLPLQSGDLVLWSENMPHSWLRSSESKSYALGQMYSLTSVHASLSPKVLESLIATGQLPYKPEGYQKKEIRVQENSRPRNQEWIWKNWSPNPGPDEVRKKRDAGWKWAAAQPHSSANVYNSRWMYDAKQDKWIKNPMDIIEIIPATYDYCSFFCGRTPATQRLREFTFGTSFGSTSISFHRRHNNNNNNHNHFEDLLPLTNGQHKKQRRMASSAAMVRSSTANEHSNGNVTEEKFEQFIRDTKDFLRDLSMDLDAVERSEEEDEQEQDENIIRELRERLDDFRDSNQLDMASNRKEVIQLLQENVLTLLDSSEWDELLFETIGEPSEVLSQSLADLRKMVHEYNENEENETVSKEVILMRDKAALLLNELDTELDELDIPVGVKEDLQLPLENLLPMKAIRNFKRLQHVLKDFYDIFTPKSTVSSSISPSNAYRLLLMRQRIARLMSEIDKLTHVHTERRQAAQMLRETDEVVRFIQSIIPTASTEQEPSPMKLFRKAIAPLYDKGFTKQRLRSNIEFRQPSIVLRRIKSFIDNTERVLRVDRAWAKAAQQALDTLKQQPWFEPEVESMEVDNNNNPDDVLTEIQKALPALEQKLEKQLTRKRWRGLREQIQTRLVRIQDTIQKTSDEQAVSSQLKSLIGGLRKRIAKEENEELRSKLEDLRNDLLGLRRKLLSSLSKQELEVVVVPETPSPEKEKKKKRKRTPPVALEKEPSVEEQLQPHGVDSLVVHSVLALVDFQRYSMNYRSAEAESQEQELDVGSTDLGSVYYDRVQDRIVIELTLQRGSLRLHPDDKLSLSFSDKLVTRVQVTNTLLTEQHATIRLISQTGTEETVILRLTSTPRGDILAVSWFVQLDVLIHLLAALGPRPRKRVRRTEKEEEEEKEITKKSYTQNLIEELEKLARTLQVELDKRVAKTDTTTHIEFRTAVNQLLAALTMKQIRKTKKQQQKLFAVIQALQEQAESESRDEQVFTQALQQVQQAGSILDKLREWQEALPEKLEALEELKQIEDMLQPPFESEAMRKVSQNIGTAREMLDARIHASTEKESKTNIPNRYLLDSLDVLEPEDTELAGELRGLIRAFIEAHKKNLISRIRKKSPKEEISAAQEMEPMQIEPEPEPEPEPTIKVAIGSGTMKRRKEQRLNLRSSPGGSDFEIP